MESHVLAKGPAGQYFSDLVKACEDHFNRIYPDYVNSAYHETVMCPPAFQFGYIAPTGQASGATALSKIEKDNIRGDTAELKMFHMLEKFGKETIQPMFVFTKFEISKLIINILQQKLPSDHPILAKMFEDLHREFDFLIIHRHIGVILIEVKAAEKFAKSNQRKAQEQLQLGEEIILALLYADDKQEINIPVHKVVAMPNVCDPCRENQNFTNLRDKNVRSDGDFISWWEMKFAKKEFGCHEKRELQSLISILVGQTCEVSSDVLLDVCKKIENQNFLRKSYEKSRRQAVNGSQGVVRTSEQPEQAILAKQFLFLNPDQLRIWKGPLHQFFNGSSGSGKTILLQFKALECTKKGEKVTAVVPSPLTAQYKDFFAENNISSGVDVLSPTEFFHGRDPGSDAAKLYFFADELQAFQTEIPDALTHLEKLLIHLADRDCYCWIAYDYMQIYKGDITREEEVTAFFCGAAIQDQARELCMTHNYYHAPCLRTTVRSTFEVYSFVQHFVKKALGALVQTIQLPLFDHIEKETKEIMVQFEERYDVSHHLGHHICGPSVTVFQNSDFNFITEVIQDEVKNWTKGGSLHQVAILLPRAFPKEQLTHVMAEKEIPVCDIGKPKNAVVLDFAHKAYSYEWPVVVAISWSPNLTSNYTMFTRAVSKLVVVTSGNVSAFKEPATL